MEILVDTTPIHIKQTSALVIGCYQDESIDDDIFSTEFDPDLKNVLNTFHKKFGVISECPTFSKISSKRIIFVGLGKRTDFSKDKSRIISGKVVLYCKEHSIDDFSIVPFCNHEYLKSIVEGIVLSSYSFSLLKNTSNEDDHKLNYISLMIDSSQKNNTNDIIIQSKKISEAVNFCRDICNLPPNQCTPSYLADIAKELSKHNSSLKTTIIDSDEMTSKNMNGILSVGKGSINQPKLILIEYKNNLNSNTKPILLVGKAVTFDSGGLSLKPSQNMDEMKFDKCGGVNVLAIMKALSSLDINIPVIGVIPSVENMPSENSYRPSDIITMYNGTNVEVLNTDAEGRMILADALSYAIHVYKPKIVIDMATLTGACIVALGCNVAGIMGNNQDIIKNIINISKTTDEHLWELPIFDEHHEQIKSKIADIKNIGGRTGGAITAAAFLSKFVNDVPWVHIDIAGTAWIQEGTIPKSYNPPGATGFGVRTILEYIISDIEKE